MVSRRAPEIDRSNRKIDRSHTERYIDECAKPFGRRTSRLVFPLKTKAPSNGDIVKTRIPIRLFLRVRYCRAVIVILKKNRLTRLVTG